MKPTTILKRVSFSNKKLIKGIDILADAVASTLGASGRCVILEDDFGGASVTKDGVTVAKSITAADPVENLGITLVRQAAESTANKAGDGTTTATVLARAIIKAYHDQGAQEYSFRRVRKTVEDYMEKIIRQLKYRSVALDSKRLRHVSIISTNADHTLGGMIAEAFEKAGDNGVVTSASSADGTTYVEAATGTQLSEGPASPHFFTNIDKETLELENPLIFLSATAIPNVRKIQDILEHAIINNRAILLIAPLESQPLTALAMNKVKGNIKAAAVAPPSFGLKRKDLLDDIGLLTGARVFDDTLGDSLDAISPDMLGSADSVTGTRDTTTIVMDAPSPVVEDKIEELKELYNNETHPVMKKHFEDRLALLSAGVARIFIGADSVAELEEKKDRTDDALSAVRAAKNSGILPGGGAALAYIAQNTTPPVSPVELAGFAVLNTALYAPFIQILENAGLDPALYPLDTWGKGVDVTDGKYKDLRRAGIIDPTLVTVEALKNAVSVAMTILSTDAIVSNVRE